MTWSVPTRRTPRTPVEVRDRNSRTSVALKRIALPLRVASRTSSPSSSNSTPISRSDVSACSSLSSLLSLSSLTPWPKRIAILPFDGMLVNAAMLLRRTVPLAVANIMLRSPQPVSSSGSGRTVEIVSPSASGRRLTIGRPLVFGPPSGSRHTFIRYTRPRLEKNSTGLWVEVTNRLVTRSSSLVAMPERPLPPRFCSRNTESGVRLM